MNWNEYYINLRDPIAMKSKDPNTKLGCIIVGQDDEIRSTGYNSFPRRVGDIEEHFPERFQRPEKYLWIEHAERNAIYNAARVGVRLKGCRLYTSLIPCADCARGIIQAGITQIIYDHAKQTAYPGGATWVEGWKRVLTMLQEGHVIIHGWHKPVRTPLSTTGEFTDPRTIELAPGVPPMIDMKIGNLFLHSRLT
jgi:dCMP deaminase